MLFRAKKKSVLVGVDIDAGTVKLLELRRWRGGYRVINFSVATDLNEAYQGVSTTTRLAALAVSGSLALTKQIIMDADLTGYEREQQVWVEAARQFPDLIDQIYLDYINLGYANSAKSKVYILLIAARKDAVEAKLNSLKSVGFKPVIVDIDYYALARSLTVTFKKQTLAILNLGLEKILLVIVDKGRVVYQREDAFPGRELMLNLEQRNGVTDFGDARLNQIQQFLQFSQEVSQQYHCDEIYLGGECATIPDIAPFLSEKLNRTIILANPIEKMKIAKGLDAKRLLKLGPTLLTCCGLAMRRIKI